MSRLKLWRSAGVAAALTVAACGGEAGEGGDAGEAGEGGEAGEAGASAPAPSPATATAPAGGEAGEAGAASAYEGLAGDQRTALRLQHLKGFVLAAERLAQTGANAEAAALVGQGLLEVYDPAPDQFAALNVAAVRSASDNSAAIAAARQAIDAAGRPLDIDHAALTARMVDIATGLYRGVVQPDFVDAIEYQHSYGAALAARDALVAGEAALRRADRTAYREALEEMDRFIALWPSPTAPETPAPYRDVLTQGSRVRLALSPFL